MARTNHPTHRQPQQPAAPTSKQSRQFIKLTEVKALTTLSTSEIYRRIASGTFPSQIMLGPKSAVWIEAEVLAWCEARIVASRRGSHDGHS